jgi:hypothetical protein
LKTLVLVGGLAIALLLAAGIYFVITRVRLAGPDEITNKPKR